MRNIAALLLFLVSLPLQAQHTVIDSLRLWAAPDHTRLVFDTSAPVSHSLFSLQNPDRLVIDIRNARIDTKLPVPKDDNGQISRIRSATRNGKDLRVVLDLKAGLRPKSFVLQPNRQYGHRLVVDLYDKVSKETKSVKSVNEGGLRDIVIAIDAGHGGEDPGARGRQGTYEKDVVLAIARKLEALLKREKGMRPVMIRTGDYYLGLRKRMKKARQSRADLFVSIHADAFKDRRVRGASVYTLSRRGASSEAARWLAERENSADLVGGVELKDKDDVLASVLLDLSQTGTLQAGHDVAGRVLKRLNKIGKTHKRTVQKAGFVVLKSPDVPSILVETAFISNPSEERNLRSPAHQRKVARSILAGIRDYFSIAPPHGTLLAKLQQDAKPKRYVIGRGDTLGGIAQRYQVSLRSLRSENGISGDKIRIGQVLRIPET
jgi:N-acetylmuramoyl-L-alanine amidase